MPLAAAPGTLCRGQPVRIWTITSEPEVEVIVLLSQPRRNTAFAESTVSFCMQQLPRNAHTRSSADGNSAHVSNCPEIHRKTGCSGGRTAGLYGPAWRCPSGRRTAPGSRRRPGCPAAPPRSSAGTRSALCWPGSRPLQGKPTPHCESFMRWQVPSLIPLAMPVRSSPLERQS